MKNFMTLAIMSISSVTFAVTPSISEEKKISNFYDSHLIEIQDSFNEEFDESWNAGQVEKVQILYNFNEEKIGYVVNFTNGYISTTNDYQMLDMSLIDRFCFADASSKIYYNCGEYYLNENNKYVNHNDEKKLDSTIACGDFDSNILYSIYEVLPKNGFMVNYSCAKLPSLKKFNQDSWGDYVPVSFKQGDETDCGVIAIMDLLYTYKNSNSRNYIKDSEPKMVRTKLQKLTNYKGNIAGKGMLPFDMVRGCNEYIDVNGVKLKEVEYKSGLHEYDIRRPGICLYQNARLFTSAHFAMRIGSAQHDYAWHFKTYLDIIVSWDQNYPGLENCEPHDMYSTLTGYYVVDSKYRQVSYQLYNGENVLE